MERDLVAYVNCVVAVCVLCFFLTVSWVGLRPEIVAIPHGRIQRGGGGGGVPEKIKKYRFS